MALTPEQMILRENKLTASAIGCLMTGEAEKVLDLWKFMVGAPGYVDRDWDHFWPARLGSATEMLNLEWYEYRAGRKLSRQGEVVMHPKYDWACCTLDAFDDALPGPVDAKHCGGFEQRATIVARYTPQMIWQMDCTATRLSALSIIEGAKEPAIEPVEWEAEFSAELWRRAEAFMECVWSLTPPIEMPAIAAPVPAIKDYDMAQSNTWAAQAGAWLDHRLSAKTFGIAEKELKALVPADAKRCFGHGIQITKAKNGALTVKEMTA